MKYIFMVPFVPTYSLANACLNLLPIILLLHVGFRMACPMIELYNMVCSLESVIHVLSNEIILGSSVACTIVGSLNLIRSLLQIDGRIFLSG